MNERIHIIITGERGKTHKLHLPKRMILITSIFAVVLLVSLTLISGFSVTFFTKNRAISNELADLRLQVSKSDEVIANIQRQASAESSRLKLQITSLKLRNANQLASFEEEKDFLLSTAVSELNQRSELIETIIGKIGVKVSNKKTEQDNKNRGGPFIEHNPAPHEDLLLKADAYMETIKAIPLGRPVKGSITSDFGPRRDPVNNKRSFHEGIDFKGQLGDNIYATGAGVVTKAMRNGSYGNFVEIDHKNGYKTTFAHMKKYLVDKGDKVKRGQVIGQVGNTGRSTGAHLHYELLYKGKPVDPQTFMQVSKLLETPKKILRESN